MIKFIKSKIRQIKRNVQRPLLQTGEYLDQIIIRSALIFIRKITRFVRAGLI